MNPGGVVLIVAALWVGTQVLAGNALERLGLLNASGAATGATGAATSTTTTTPEQAAASGYTTPMPRLNIPKPV